MVRTGKLFALLLFALLSACRGETYVVQPPAVVPMSLVIDDLGRTVRVPVNITRAVSLAPSATEMIFAVGAGDRLVGVTTFCDYPDEAKAIEKIGDTMNPNLETIVALQPDVVFVSTASQIENFVQTLESNDISIYVLNSGGMMGLYHGLMELGSIFDTSDKAARLVYELAQREDNVRMTLLSSGLSEDGKPDRKSIRVFVQISREPLFTIGKGVILNELIEAAAGKSVTDGIPSAYPKLSKETALALQPEAIILSDSPDNQEPNEVFKNSPAVKNGRVYKINADLLSRPGPRLVDALEQIAKDLHPEKFK